METEKPDYWTERFSPDENEKLKRLRNGQQQSRFERSTAEAALNKLQKPIFERQEPVREWLRKIINKDYAELMTMPVEEQQKQNKHFNANPRPLDRELEFLPFAEGVEICKHQAIIELTERKEVRHGVRFHHEHGGFKQRATVGDAAKAEAYYKSLDEDMKTQADLIKTLIDAEVGFYNFTEKQYELLRKSNVTCHVPREYQKIEDSRPTELLKNIPYSEFRALVADVLQEMGLPKSMPDHSQQLAVTKYDKTVENWIQDEFKRLDSLPKPVPKVVEPLHLGKHTSPYGKLGLELRELQKLLDPKNEQQQEAFEKVVSAYNKIRPQTNKDKTV